jgi:arthrofactin-type cyclic lipopeptide synthetase C
VNDNFFELGGHSLLAAIAIHRLQHAYPQVTLVDLFQNPTIRSLSSIVSKRTLKATRDAIVPLHSEGDQPPLFLVHDISGGVFPYVTLAGQLRINAPIFGIQLPQIADVSEYQTITQLAKSYVDLIVQLYPTGPYRIAGWSLGGTIALAIAHELLGNDKQVVFVGLIDSYIRPIKKSEAELSDDDIASDCILFFSRLHKKNSTEVDGSTPVAVASDLHGYLDAYRFLYKLAVRHTAQPLPIPVHLYKATQSNYSDNDWSELLPNLQQSEIQGDHWSILSDGNCATLAEKMTNAIRPSNTQQSAEIPDI